MSNLQVQERQIVVPGEILAKGMDFLPGDNTYRENDTIFAKTLGLVGVDGRVIKLTPVSGPYVPAIGDKIIAKVIDITMNGWRVETATAYSAMLNVRDASSRFIKRHEDLSKILAIGDFIVAKISNVTSQKLIDVTMKEPGLHKIEGGRLLRIKAQKVPRVIGKKASMVMLLKEKTGCSITIGQNGLVWLKGTPEGELLCDQAIKLIEAKAHLNGLTQRMNKFLDANPIELPPVASKQAREAPKTFAQRQAEGQ